MLEITSGVAKFFSTTSTGFRSRSRAETVTLWKIHAFIQQLANWGKPSRHRAQWWRQSGSEALTTYTSCFPSLGSAELPWWSWWWWWWRRWCRLLWDPLPSFILSGSPAAPSSKDIERLLWRLWMSESDGLSSSLDLWRFLCLDLILSSDSSSNDRWRRLRLLVWSFLVDLRSSSSLL